MEFIQQFIAEVAGGEHCLDVAAGKAYSKSLRMYHNWIVKGIFSVSRNDCQVHTPTSRHTHMYTQLHTHTHTVGDEGCPLPQRFPSYDGLRENRRWRKTNHP